MLVVFAGSRLLITKVGANPAILPEWKFCFYQDFRIHMKQILSHWQNKMQSSWYNVFDLMEYSDATQRHLIFRIYVLVFGLTVTILLKSLRFAVIQLSSKT